MLYWWKHKYLASKWFKRATRANVLFCMGLGKCPTSICPTSKCPRASVQRAKGKRATVLDSIKHIQKKLNEIIDKQSFIIVENIFRTDRLLNKCIAYIIFSIQHSNIQFQSPLDSKLTCHNRSSSQCGKCNWCSTWFTLYNTGTISTYTFYVSEIILYDYVRTFCKY
jgi:hypothetical protein